MIIKIFRKEDLKKDGLFKKKNNVKLMNEEEFINYVRTNKLTLSKGYIDITGFISNGEMFKCSYNNMMVGVTGIINKVNEV